MTCDRRVKNYSDMCHSLFLNSTCDMGINKRQRHATLAFLKIDRRHGDPPSRGDQRDSGGVQGPRVLTSERATL